MHAFPSPQDAANFSWTAQVSGRRLLYMGAKVFQSFVKLAHLLRFFWFDLFYAILVVVVTRAVIILIVS